MDADDKRAAIQAKRGPLEHELFAAELDVATAKEASDKALHEEPEKRLKEVKAKLKVLDDKEAKL